ncbi:NAD(P)-dependent dehydrogenase, short-chain alcohol dehydrogenase family [Amycolatopsis xylanica]|uniref:NAD(P)-dependent dehydrogenase, short-chain alcohol dehydrogenase family n=1 Tax=Amycolatopsis xylanica TaxID=589385 RepID=A0A1H3SU74_9PSEU|nr:SDR family NAD(P)-dependent oxidoreductase [Amycolatopsis xylanica]SDZ41300.1 NAD(P)-dependent dehydrogenase, short-chain alcohol dehydrogenase family [Amycolatopsis xylanica]
MLKLLDTLADRTLVPGYTKLGYRLRSKGWAPLESMRGKRVLVTGANSGLGRAAATKFAELGATVHLGVRDLAKGQQAKEELAARFPDAEIHVELCDMSLVDTVREFATEFVARHDTLDALVHNAGVLPPSRQETREGNEVTLATHVLGPFLLTGMLVPALIRAKGRVIFVSSGGMYSQKLYDQDPQFRQGKYRGATAYSRTKRMQVVLASQWAERLKGDGITVHSMHPGWAATPGVSDSLPGFATVMGPLLRDADEGADTVVWLASAPEAARETGLFWHDRAPRPEHYFPWTKESAAQRANLWAFCEENTAGT